MGNIFRKNPNAEEALADIINNLRSHFSEAQRSIVKLEQIVSEARQGDEQPERSDMPMEDLEKAVKRIKDYLNSCQHEVDNYEKIKGDGKRKVETNPTSPQAKNRKVAVVQLYCAQKTYLTNYAMRELDTMLKSKQFQKGMEFTVQTCEKPSSIQSCIPLIVICLNSSRLGVDFSSAVSGVPTGPNTVVLIFHHLKRHALPTQPSNTILTEAEFKNVGKIIDVAFFEDMGLYDCDMNKNAYKTLISFIEDCCKK